MADLLFVIILVACLYLGSLVYYRNPKSKDNKLFLVLIFWLILWMIFNYFENDPLQESIKILFLKLDFLIAPVLGYFWFLFCYHFLEKKKINLKFNLIFIFALLFLIILFLFNQVINNIVVKESVLSFQLGPMFFYYVLFILFSYMGGISLLLYKYKTKFQGKEKLQSLYVIFGFFLSSTIIIIINLFLQDKVSVDIFRMGTFGIFFLVFFTSLAIIKYQLFDIRSILQRGLIYSVLLVLIVIFYILLIFILGFLFQQNSNTTVMIAAGITVILGIYGVPIIEKYFQKITDKIFFFIL